MKRYVVTGGAGFIGSALVRRLLAAGDGEVHVIDNLFSGHEKNLDDVRSKVELHKLDIRDYGGVAAAVKGADLVVHLAAIPSVPRSIEDPVPSHEVNMDGTFNVFRACAEGKVRRVVYPLRRRPTETPTCCPRWKRCFPAPSRRMPCRN